MFTLLQQPFAANTLTQQKCDVFLLLFISVVTTCFSCSGACTDAEIEKYAVA